MSSRSRKGWADKLQIGNWYMCRALANEENGKDLQEESKTNKGFGLSVGVANVHPSVEHVGARVKWYPHHRNLRKVKYEETTKQPVPVRKPIVRKVETTKMTMKPVTTYERKSEFVKGERKVTITHTMRPEHYCYIKNNDFYVVDKCKPCPLGPECQGQECRNCLGSDYKPNRCVKFVKGGERMPPVIDFPDLVLRKKKF